MVTGQYILYTIFQVKFTNKILFSLIRTFYANNIWFMVLFLFKFGHILLSLYFVVSLSLPLFLTPLLFSAVL